MRIFTSTGAGKSDMRLDVDGLFVLDAAKQPKRITIESGKYEDNTFQREDLVGIYEFEGDRLRIAYRKGGPAPEKFESAAGSGITLLVLNEHERRGPTAAPPRQAGQGAAK